MQKRIEVSQTIELTNEKVELQAETADFEIATLKPSRQMLVDSDSVAFIYILETDTEFVYVSLQVIIWPALKTALTEDLPVFLNINGNMIQLKGIVEELRYLISNIEGNANYGDEMVTKVEEIFLSK